MSKRQRCCLSMEESLPLVSVDVHQLPTKIGRQRIPKRQRCCLSMEEPLIHDVVERILERLEVKALGRFKCVSKQWKSTIESPFFQERQLNLRKQSRDPDVLMVSTCSDPPNIELLRTLVLGSSSSVLIPTPWEDENEQYLVSYNSCDGLVCLYHPSKPGYVINPTTRWYRPLPLSGLQQRIIDLGESYFDLGLTLVKLGFGKDIITGTYKVVWLYNSSELGFENTTTCEVFDFGTNSWRYVTPASPYRVLTLPDPVFVDGKLYWFTDCQGTKVVSFDLHTEIFQLVSKAPFSNNNPLDIVVCNLDNRLCVSEKKWPDQVIWSFDSGNKTWIKIFSMELDTITLFHDISARCALHPLTLLHRDEKEAKKKKKKLLFYGHVKSRSLLKLDQETNSDELVHWAKAIGFPVCYYPSLCSIQT